MIAAPVDVVFQTFHNPEGYRYWTSAFCEGSYYEGLWEQGGRVRFLSPSGDGMVADIAAFRPNEYISLRHLGWIVNGVEDTESEAVRAWAPAFENYTFQSVPEGTRPIVDQDVLEVAPRAMPRECPPPPAARAAGAIPAIPGSRPRRG